MKVRKNLANDFQSLCKTLKIRIVAANGYTSGKRVGNKIASQVRILFSPQFSQNPPLSNAAEGDFWFLMFFIMNDCDYLDYYYYFCS